MRIYKKIHIGRDLFLSPLEFENIVCYNLITDIL